MFNFFKRPTIITALFLFILYLVALYFHPAEGFIQSEVARTLILSLGFLPPVLANSLITKQRPQVSNLLITLFILLLLSDPTTPLNLMFALGLVTGAIKSFARINHQPIFNPAAAGLLVASFFGVLTTWWGISYSPRLPFFQMSITNLLILPVGLYLIMLYKKVPTLVSIPIALTLSYFLQTGRMPLTTLFEGTFSFFLLIMATEPKTSPLVDYQEWIYGILLGAVLGWLFIHRIAPEPYLAALLALNFVFSTYRFIQAKTIKV